MHWQSDMVSPDACTSRHEDVLSTTSPMHRQLQQRGRACPTGVNTLGQLQV